MRYLFLLAALIVSTPQALAQDGAPTAYEFRIFAPGASQPQVSTPIAIPEIACNMTAPTVTSTVNPTTLIWDDVTNAGKVCQKRLDAPSAGPIMTLPSGAYEGSLLAVNAEGAAESTRVSFTRARQPAAPTGFRLSR